MQPPEYMNDMFSFKVSPYYSIHNQNYLCLPKPIERITADHSRTELLVNNNELRYMYDLRQISSCTAFKYKLNNC